MNRRHNQPVFAVILLIIAALGCSLPGSGGQSQTIPVDATKIALEILATKNAPVPSLPVDATKVALEIQATNSIMLLTQQANQSAQNIQPTQAAPSVPEQPTVVPPPVIPTEVPTRDVKERMKNARILVYEDTQNIGMWITDALNGMDLKYTHVGDGIGHLMENLNSPIQWDLIIIGAESKTKVQGEFWDVINEKVIKENTALIAEIWYLDKLGEGRIKNLTTNCGIEFQRDWPLADSIYWLDPSHPIFSDPNLIMPFINYSRYWPIQAGDLIRLSPGSNATLLAGILQKQKTDYGVLATCMDGRVVIQTFSNHDYHKDQVTRLWQNYITNTLKSRFAIVP
ncbi:MAG: hypothetical protein WCP19_12200 [Chloroflexota bacterium]